MHRRTKTHVVAKMSDFKLIVYSAVIYWRYNLDYDVPCTLSRWSLSMQRGRNRILIERLKKDQTDTRAMHAASYCSGYIARPQCGAGSVLFLHGDGIQDVHNHLLGSLPPPPSRIFFVSTAALIFHGCNITRWTSHFMTPGTYSILLLQKAHISQLPSVEMVHSEMQNIYKNETGLHKLAKIYLNVELILLDNGTISSKDKV